MPQSLSELERQRSLLSSQLSQLGDLRPGSVTGIVRRCGKPTSMPSDRKSRVVGQLPRTIFPGLRKTGHLDLEAVEMLVRSATDQAGASSLIELLPFPVPEK